MSGFHLKRKKKYRSMSSGYDTPSKRARFNSLHGRRRNYFDSPERTSPNQETPSPFARLSFCLTPEQLTVRIKEQIDRLGRKRLGRIAYLPKKKQNNENSEVADSQAATTSAAETSELYKEINDKPMLSLEQMNHLCSRQLKEQEENIREEYEKLLKNKSADQYDVFLRFQHDELKKKLSKEERPSYLN